MKEISLYIHIPFCKEKCKYCDFLSFKNTENIDSYINSLLNEINAFDTDKNVKSIFIGGGTPSFINEKYIEKIMYALNKFSINKNAEITIEANPGTLTKNKLKIYKNCGINRISMGLQAWQNDILKFLGRIHTKEDFLESYNLSREAGFENINIDLMFSLPNQSFEMWKETLENVTNLNPDHISAYSLIVEEGTPFYNMELNLPDEETDRNMYHYAIDFLRDKGYNQYEISNFSKKGKESIHNTAYWIRSDYKGFGLGAASLIDNIRYKNTEKISSYIKGNYINEKEILSKEDIIEEFMFLGLRMTKGISINEFKNNFNKDIFSLYGNVFKKYKDFFVVNNERIALNTKGFDISNVIMSEFLF
ncbi:MAG: radical SAM family heme chaperone HemW [Lachnospirales bacterium]